MENLEYNVNQGPLNDELLRLLIDGLSDIIRLACEWAHECREDPLHGPRYSQLVEIAANTLRLAQAEQSIIQPTQSMSQVNQSQQRKRSRKAQQSGGRGGSTSRGDRIQEVSLDEEDEHDESDEHDFLFSSPPDSTTYRSIFATPSTTVQGSEDAGPSSPKGKGLRKKKIAHKKKRGSVADYTTPKNMRRK